MRTINATMRPGETIHVTNYAKSPMKVVLTGGPTATPPEVTVGAGKTVAIGPFRDEVVTYEEKAAQLRPEIRDAIETALGWGSHGTIAGYHLHRSRHTVPCEPCREAAQRVPRDQSYPTAASISVEQRGEDNSWQLAQYVRDHWSTSGPVEYR